MLNLTKRNETKGESSSNLTDFESIRYSFQGLHIFCVTCIYLILIHLTFQLETKKIFLKNLDSLILHVTIKQNFGHLFLGINEAREDLIWRLLKNFRDILDE